MIGVSSVFRAYMEALSVLNRFKIWVPLCLYVVFKIGIVLFYLATAHGSVSGFWGLFVFGEARDAIRHYPVDLLLMPVVLNRLSMVFDVFVHVIFQGATILMFADALKKREPALGPAFRETRARYGRLVGVSAVFSVVLYGVVILPNYVAGLTTLGIPQTAVTGVTIFLGLVVQALLIFATPFVLFSSRSIAQAIRDSVVVSSRSFASALLLVGLPFLLTLPGLFIETKSQALVSRLSPDILIHLQISSELVQWITTFLLLGGMTAVFVWRVQHDEARHK
jgi:hypothetical protein